MWSRIAVALVLSASTLAACGTATDPCGEGPGAENLVAAAEGWLVLGPSSFDGFDIAGEDRTVVSRVEAAPATDAEHRAPFATTPVAIHTSFVPDIRRALDEGATVWLALASSGLEREQVAYPLARLPDGSHRLLGGDCMDTANRFLQAGWAVRSTSGWRRSSA